LKLYVVSVIIQAKRVALERRKNGNYILSNS
jgi:hypothetical protein